MSGREPMLLLSQNRSELRQCIALAAVILISRRPSISLIGCAGTNRKFSRERRVLPMSRVTWHIVSPAGPFRTGWLSADSFGVYDQVERQWSPLLLDAIDLSPDRLPDTIPPGKLLGDGRRQAANETGVPEGVPTFTAGGDGAYAGLGTDCTRKDRAYVNLGTAVVSGAWSPEYLNDRAWRTLLAAQGEGICF